MRKLHISFSAQLTVFFIYKPEWQLHPTLQKKISLDFFSTSFSPLGFPSQLMSTSSTLDQDAVPDFLLFLTFYSQYYKSCWFYLQGHFGFVWAHLSALTMQAITFSLLGNCTRFPEVFLAFTLGFLYVILHRDSRDFFIWYESTDTISLLRNFQCWTTPLIINIGN